MRILRTPAIQQFLQFKAKKGGEEGKQRERKGEAKGRGGKT